MKKEEKNYRKQKKKKTNNEKIPHIGNTWLFILIKFLIN